MDALSDILLQNLLRTNEEGIVYQREDDEVEFKEYFDNTSKQSKAKYAKELAALYNCKGGYLIFGVNDKSNELVGLQNFTELDNADLANDLNSCFSPAFTFKSKVMLVNGKTVFVIYLPQRATIPTICLKDSEKVLSKSTIYWRYSGQSKPIEPGDLQNLFNEVQGVESKKQTEIARQEFRARYKPRLVPLPGGISHNGSFTIQLENRGEVAYLKTIELVECSIDLKDVTINQISQTITLERSNSVEISGRCHVLNPQNLEFKLSLKYESQENFQYEMTIIWNRCLVKMFEIKEL